MTEVATLTDMLLTSRQKLDAATSARAKLEYKLNNDKTQTNAMIVNMTEKVFTLEKQLSIECSSKMQLFGEFAEL